MPPRAGQTRSRALLARAAARLVLTGGVIAWLLTLAIAPAALGQDQPTTPPPASAPAPAPAPAIPPQQPPTTTPPPANPPAASPQPPAAAQPPEPSLEPLSAFEGRPIREVRLIGATTPENNQLALAQMRSKSGQPLSIDTVRDDIHRLTRLGRFRPIDASVQPMADGSVILTYTVGEAKLIQDVQWSGNHQLSDQEIRQALPELIRTPVDEFEIGRTMSRIQDLYRKKGYYLAEVTLDRDELNKTGIVLFKIRERERIRVTDIRFRGNRAFGPDQLFPVIHTKIAGLFETGPLDDEVLDQDVAALIGFYRDHGYLDVRADREVRPSPDAREAIVTFIIDEGPLYTLRSIQAELDDGAGRPSGKPPTVFTVEQLAGIMLIKAGDAYSVDRLEKSIKAVGDAYGKLGYTDSRIARAERRDPDRPVVDLVLIITEGRAFRTGTVDVKGDNLTQRKVILRQVRVLPMRPLDTTLIRESKEALDNTRLFEGGSPGAPSSVRITLQDPPTPDADTRDVLVEVKETNTGKISFGVGVSSDAGLAGIVSVTQRNFDPFDFPQSFGEIFNGRAFRGAGQTFNLTLSPGTSIQDYSLSVGDPYLFETDYSGSAGAFYRTQIFDKYDQDALGGQLALGRRFGDRWTASVVGRAARVELRSIDVDAPVDVFDAADPHVVTGLGLRLDRTTFNHPLRPTRGTKISLGVEQVGALGGDYDFTKISGEYLLFVPLYEDFLGRTTTVSFKTTVGYIPQDVSSTPIYERYFLGGRSLRGFRYRDVSPKGIRHDTLTQGDQPIGGTWSFFAGAELEQPLYQDLLAGALFIDTGTVTDTPGFSQYRISVGAGLRISIPMLSPAPLAFDFAVPILLQDGDHRRLFSFSFDIPF